MKSEIAALGAGLFKDRSYLANRLEYSYDQMFKVLGKRLLDEGRQAKVDIYEHSRKTVDVYPDCWKSSLNGLGKTATNLLKVSSPVVQAASDVLLSPAPKAQAASGSQGNDDAEYQLSVENNSSAAGPDHSSY